MITNTQVTFRTVIVVCFVSFGTWAVAEDNQKKGANQSSAKRSKTDKSFSLQAKDFDRGSSAYYLDEEKWLAIDPKKGKEATATSIFSHTTGVYDVTLRVVAEDDGSSTYRVKIGGETIGEHTCPRSKKSLEESDRFNATWKNVKIRTGDRIEIGSTINSKKKNDQSRGRWSTLVFKPVSEKQKQSKPLGSKSIPSTPDTRPETLPTIVPTLPAATLRETPNLPATPILPATPATPLLVPPREPNGSGQVAITGALRIGSNVAITLDGPFAHKNDRKPNPTKDLKMSVKFVHESGEPERVIEGSFVGDGHGEAGLAESGVKWRAYFTPDKIGRWRYFILFTSSKNAESGEPNEKLAPYDGIEGRVLVE